MSGPSHNLAVSLELSSPTHSGASLSQKVAAEREGVGLDEHPHLATALSEPEELGPSVAEPSAGIESEADAPSLTKQATSIAAATSAAMSLSLIDAKELEGV